MAHGSSSASSSSRDLRIDWLRGLAMTCVIVNHSKMSSLLSWFSYERFWVVTAAEVFVALSGVVIGMVYGRRLARDGWRTVVRGLGRRALLLYASFVAVTVSTLVISLAGVDVQSLTTGVDRSTEWFLNPRGMDVAAWRDVALMRGGPWAFEIVGLYVWLVLAAVPCLLTLRFAGWQPLLAVSWVLYFSYRLAPHQLTAAEFESTFPILAWQLLFVHGITIGYYRERVGAFVAQCPKAVPIVAAGVSMLFFAFALSNPWANGPSWLHWSIVSPERFADLYGRYFALEDLGIGRLLNLAVALPLGYAALAWCWRIARPLQTIFVTLGQRSLGAFVLHVYGLLLLEHVPHPDVLWLNTLIQILLVVGIAALLTRRQRLRPIPRHQTDPHVQPLAA